MGSIQAGGSGATKFGINPGFIKEAVNSIVGPELTFVLSDPKQAYLLKPSEGERHKMVMMPMSVVETSPPAEEGA